MYLFPCLSPCNLYFYLQDIVASGSKVQIAPPPLKCGDSTVAAKLTKKCERTPLKPVFVFVLLGLL